jgi:hypothetical protein
MRTLLVLLGAAVALSACSTQFDPVSYVPDLRVLAIVADPPELALEQEVTLTPVVHVPPSMSATLAWSFCPYSLGPSAAYVCAVPECEVPVPMDANGAVHADPTALALGCWSKIGSSLARSAGLPATPPDRFEVLFRLNLHASDGSETREAVARIEQWTKTTTTPFNRNPAISSIASSATTAVPGQAVRFDVHVDPTSLDTYTDPSGVVRTESPVVSFFATAGRFDQTHTDGLDSTEVWTATQLAPTDTQATIWIVVRDERGGVAVSGPHFISIAQ